MSITDNVKTILNNICVYETKYHRPPNSVKLLGASKKQSAEKIIAAYHAGLTSFGENYLQEAEEKMALIPADIAPYIEWHFIGHIQRNKTRKIAEHFSWVHSVDDIRIAERLSEHRPEYLPPLNVCIEVNISNEGSKSGIAIKNTIEFARECALLPRLTLRGLMAIPAHADTFAKQREQFHTLNELKQALIKQNLNIDTLSMGMSDDYEAAIAEGSTIVRIGTALFGARN
jgi:pyridoxal phosphate enzyme (YggS family)